MFFGHILFVTSGLYGLISASAIRGTSKNENEVGIDSSLVDSGEVSLSREGRYFYQSVNTVIVTSTITATSTCYLIDLRAPPPPRCASSMVLLGKRKRRSAIETSPIKSNNKIDELIIVPSATSNPSKTIPDQYEEDDYLDGSQRSDRQLQLYPFIYTTTLTTTSTTFTATRSIILGCTIGNSNFAGFNSC